MKKNLFNRVSSFVSCNLIFTKRINNSIKCIIIKLHKKYTILTINRFIVNVLIYYNFMETTRGWSTLRTTRQNSDCFRTSVISRCLLSVTQKPVATRDFHLCSTSRVKFDAFRTFLRRLFRPENYFPTFRCFARWN